MMTDNEIKDEATKLREELRNVRRNGGSQGNPGARQGSGSTDASQRSNSEDIGADAGRPSGNAETLARGNRGAKGRFERGGQDNGRSLDDRGGAAIRDDQAANTSLGLIRADIAANEPLQTKRPVGRPPKIVEDAVDKATKVKTALFKKKSPLTEKEAKDYQESLTRVIQSYGEYADGFVKWRTQDPNMPDIWGNLTDIEAQCLANIMLRRGVKNEHAAETVRAMLNGEDYVSVGVMMIPRVIATTEQMKKAPRRQRKTKHENSH